MGRFRYVTAQLLARRFGVTEINARKRLHRLCADDLVARHPVKGHQALYLLTPAGSLSVGQPARRKAPRPDTQRDHELAIVALVVDLELADRNVVVYTERQCRQRASEGLQKFAATVEGENGRPQLRWPDLVLVTPGGAIAIELEFAPKSTVRLQRMLRGYLTAPLVEVHFYVGDRLLATRLNRLCSEATAHMPLDAREGLTHFRVDAWKGLPADQRAAIRAAVT